MIDKLKAELESVNSQINALTLRRSVLERMIMDKSTDFVSKFTVWYEGSGGRHAAYFPTIGGKFPKFKEWYDREKKRFDLEKNRTYTLDDLFVNPLNLIMYPEDYKETHTPEDINSILKEFQPIFEEFMNNNIKTFTYDW